jgi:hypothetical protein
LIRNSSVVFESSVKARRSSFSFIRFCSTKQTGSPAECSSEPRVGPAVDAYKPDLVLMDIRTPSSTGSRRPSSMER